MNKSNLLFAILLCFSTVLQGQNYTVASSAGGDVQINLKSQLGTSPLSTVTSLTVTGTIDATDFRFIRDSLNATLQSLNLSGCNIDTYTGTGGTNHTAPGIMGGGGVDVQTTYNANELPVFAFYKMWKGTGPFGATYEVSMTALSSLSLPTNITTIGKNALSKMTAFNSALTLSAFSSLIAIGDNAFTKSAFTSVVLPNTVQTIGSVVFQGCANLQSVNFPTSVTKLGKTSGFFEGCTSLSSVTFAEPCQIDTLPFRMFYSSPSTEEANLRLSSLLTVTVPSSVTNVTTAFENFIGTAINCHASNTVYCSENGVLYLKPACASGTLVALPKGLTSFTIPASMTVIPANMFENCTALTSITINSALTEIGNRAFYNAGLTSFNFPNTLTKIGNEAFQNSKLTEVNLTDNALLTTLGSNIFATCPDLITANISGLDVLGISMFKTCTNLASVTFNSNLTAIPLDAFSGCRALTSVSLPNTITNIGNSAFMSCYALQNINMPTSLVSLGRAAFSGDTLITQFNLPASFQTIVVETGYGTPFTNTYAQIYVAPENPYLASENGILLTKTKKTALYIPILPSRPSVVVPNGVDTIAMCAFGQNMKRTVHKLTLPISLKRIENYGLEGAKYLDTLIVKANTPPAVGNLFYALNNRYTSALPVVLIPALRKPAYIAAAGWQYYYDPAGSQAGTPYDKFVQQTGFYDMGGGMALGLSPNGNYAVGNTLGKSYLFKINEGVVDTIPNATYVYGVNDKMYIAADRIETYGSFNLNTGAVYRNGQWYPIGLGRYGNSPTSEEVRASVTCIDSAGNVYGSTYTYNSIARVVPFAWKYNATADNYTTDTMAFASPAIAGDQGAKISSISSNGTVAAGWLSRSLYGGGRSAIGWTSPTTYKLFDTNNFSEAKSVSPNGRYIATQKDRRAALYDVENDTLIVFGLEETSPTGVSDNGFVIGFQQRGTGFESGRQGFIWSDKLGFMYFRQFLDQYAADAEILDSEFFGFPNNRAVYDVPVAISADGLVMTGWCGFTSIATKGWVLCLADTLRLIDRPKGLVANVNIADRNKVNLSWNAPTGYAPHTLDFYEIYRDGISIARVDASDGTTYIDNNVPSGYAKYTVSALFDYDLQSQTPTYIESGKSNIAEVTIVDNYDIPFAEGFESGTLTYNFWTEEHSSTSTWMLSDVNSLNGIYSALFLASGEQQPYNLSMTSKPLDATGHNKVILAYAYRILSSQTTFVGVKDTFYVEIGVGNVWTKVQTIVINDKKPWTLTQLDVSSVAANKIFKVRFRGVSGANRNLYNFNFDDFGVAFEENITAPSGVLAYRFSNDTKVNVIYKDVTGAYGLTYTQDGRMYSSAGNEGAPIIAVNKYDASDLKPLTGKYLTSVSAFLQSDYAGTTIPSELKLAVFVNGTRVENASIASWKGHAWNNFALSTPVHINGTETILVGIEAAHGDQYNRPLSIDGDELHTNAKGNLYSEDGGTTWLNTSTQEIWGNWGITANFRDETTAQSIDDDLFDVVYLIYRNGVAIDTLHYGQRYIDTLAIADNDCYKVKVFRSLGGMSPMSAETCGVTIISKIPTVKSTEFAVYPNPTKDFVNITVDIQNVKVFDMNGKMLMQTASKQVNISNLTNGMYILEATLANGQRAFAKVVKE